jgi:phage protein D
MKMTLGRKNANYLEQTDSDIIANVIGSHGLSPTVDATPVRLKQLTQYLASDWDFVLTRAEANGLIVLVDEGAVPVREPIPSSATPVLVVTYGTDLMEFHGAIDARTQYAAVKGACWDPDQRTVTGATTAAMMVTDQAI